MKNPKTKHQGMTKHQQYLTAIMRGAIGVRNLEIPWCLVLGIWCLGAATYSRLPHGINPAWSIDTILRRSYVPRSFSPMKTFSAKANEVTRKWWIIDAKDQILGDVAVKAANLLRGKEKPIFTPHVDTGDFVVVINAEKVRVTGGKEEAKTYMSFSGYVGGHKSENVKARRARHPELIVERAVRGMIPHNRLGRAVYRKLKVYRGDSHPHAAQQPEAVTLA